MATANELFAANGEDYIVIDSDLRTMTFPASVNNIGVENDKDVHKLNFKMPRYFSGYDLSEFIIHINYVNATGDADMYYVLDPTVEENEIIFSWLVGRHACLYRGSVTFIVCLKLADGEGDVAQEFNTTLASLQVLPGLETEPTILETEHDVIEQLLLSINDTNAKIKAVLDTGLTPEQIAEFYDKSKTYDTQITALNSKTIPWASYGGQIEVTLDDVSFLGISDFTKSAITGNGQKWVTVRVSPAASAPKVEPFYGASFALTINCSSVNYGWGWLQSDNDINQLYYGRLGGGKWTWYKVGKQDDIDALNSKTTVTAGNNYMNLNDLKSTAIYSYDTTSANVQNAPDTGTYFSGTLYVTYYNESKSTQVFIRPSGDVWTRFWWNDTWKSWTKLANQSDVDALNSSTTPQIKTVSYTAGENVNVRNLMCVKMGKLVELNFYFDTTAQVENNAHLVDITDGLPKPIGSYATGIARAVNGSFALVSLERRHNTYLTSWGPTSVGAYYYTKLLYITDEE